MFKAKSISIIFPAYNEQDNILESVRNAEKFAVKKKLDYEIIIVNDGSKDQTKQLVLALCKQNKRVKLINHAKNQGYGSTVFDGLKSAKKDLIFFTDSDLQFKIDELDRFFLQINEFDVVIGYRSPRSDPFMRILNAWAWKQLIRVVFGIKIKDVDCAFKLFRRDSISDLYVRSRGAMFSAEMIIKLLSQKKKIKQLPVSHYRRMAGSPTGAKPSVIAKAFRELSSVRKELKRDLSQIDGCERIIF